MSDPLPSENIRRYWRNRHEERGCISDREREVAQPKKEYSDEAEWFEDQLLDAGVDPDQAAMVMEFFDEVLKRLKKNIAALAVRELLLRIADTKTGKTPEFRALLYLFSDSKSIDEIASEAGLSPQSVHYHVQKLRPNFDISQKPAAYVKGNGSPETT